MLYMILDSTQNGTYLRLPLINNDNDNDNDNDNEITLFRHTFIIYKIYFH